MTPSITDMIQRSKVLRQNSSDTKLTKGIRRRGSLPSPPLEHLNINDNDCDLIEEENTYQPEIQGDCCKDDFADEEENEILVLFQESEHCDDNEESEKDENSWSPSPIPADSDTEENKRNTTYINSSSSSKLSPPVLDEENGKLKVTEKFMKDLIEYV